MRMRPLLGARCAHVRGQAMRRDPGPQGSGLQLRCRALQAVL